MPSKIKIEFCTSCGSKDIEVTGQKYYCSTCDVTYIVTEAGTKVVSTNPLGKTNTRLDQVEKDVADLQGKKPASKDPTDPPASVPENNDIDDDEDEPDGFITIE